MMHVESSQAELSDIDKMSDFFGPGHVDHTVRSAIQACWMALPKERRTRKELRKQISRLVQRALKDFEEDWKVFGKRG